LALPTGHRWRANSVLTMTADWENVARQSRGLFASQEPAPPTTERLDPIALLEHWMLPDERRRGWMVLSFLDKPPFSSAQRFDAAHCFAGFHSGGEGGGDHASARVALFASNRHQVTVTLTGPDDWQLAAGEQR